MVECVVVDQSVRDRVAGDLTTTYLLEAAAGTGKTKVLVDRYVNCVLDPERGAGDVRSVAAITFTEKAAGELRQRVRETLERMTQDAALPERRLEAVQRALDDLDDAPISTIHSFAGRLLREFPVAAGVDPAFEQLDALAGDMGRARLWEEWLADLAADDRDERPARAWLVRLVRAGVRLDDVRKLAAGPRGVFGERYDVDAVTEPLPEPDLHRALERLAEPSVDLRMFCNDSCCDPSDGGYRTAAELTESIERLLTEPPGTIDALAARLFGLTVKSAGPGGRKANWDDGGGGKDELQRRYAVLRETVGTIREEYAAFVVGLAIAVADSFARWAAETQVALGRLDFADLLGRLRDLLAADLDARRALQARFRYILVDEFQDTDPLQAEIVFLLCEREPLTADWRSVVLEPGKLFVVGDPKQSIYRFRRADIAIYDEVADLIRSQPGGAGSVEMIRQNFRTTAAAVEWVNDTFAEVFESDKAKGRQPGYGRVASYRPFVAGDAAVSVLLGREYGSRAGESTTARRDEGRALAALLCDMTSAGAARWRVQDRAAQGRAVSWGAEPTRPAQWGDIAVLMRSTTGLAAYEQALREAGVPYRVEGGTTFFERREVADALVCLRAIDDPSDGPAVYAALHSTLFGFSDDDLYLFVADGGRLDVFGEDGFGEEDAVCPEYGIPTALRLLRDLHGRRIGCEPDEIVADLLRRTRAAELAASSGPGAPQAMANLEKLVERARAFAGAGGGGLAAFLSWAADAGDAAGEQESQAEDEGDVVRLLTIHKAKGLEFPIVVLAGGGLSSGSGREGIEPIIDRANRRLTVKLRAELPGRPVDLEPALYTQLKEHEATMDASEQRRLLYVAATRARDHLVLSCFGSLARADGGPRKNVMFSVIKDRLPVPQAEACAKDLVESGLLVLAPVGPRFATVAPRGDAEALVAARAGWMAEQRELVNRARVPAAAASPSGLEHVDFDLADLTTGLSRGRSSALALGTMVHAVMERCDLRNEMSVFPAAAAVAAEMGRADLAGEAAELASVCWRSGPVRAAACSVRVYRELPIGVLIEGAIVNAAVDLLYDDDGRWVIADFKTDRDTEPGSLFSRYRPQAAAYAVAFERATGAVVRDVVLIAARASGTTVTVAVDDALRELAAQEVARVASGRGAPAADELGPQ